MSVPYGLMADLHCAGWSAFASLDEQGRNTRLMEIIHEINRCSEAVLDAGGNMVIIAGDVFHHRGTVTPSVYNPLAEALFANEDIEYQIIPGNHDLESRDCKALTSAVTMLNDLRNVHSYHKPVWSAVGHCTSFVPWVANARDYLAAIELAARGVGPIGETDLICHIGIDGTLSSMPDHGVTAAKLKDFGFKRVFSGHYHHHKDFGNGVYSIGAATHQTWSDVGTKAGWMLVYPDREVWHASHAPSFIDRTGAEEPEEVPLLVDGNYVRARIGTASAKDVAEFRQLLEDAGAKGVIVQAIPETTASKRAGVTAKSLAALDQAVADYVSERSLTRDVGRICAEVLSEVRAT